LTNFHVVSGADEIEVKLHDNRVFDATIVGSDSLSDVAVLKLTESVPDLPVAYLGNSDSIRPGDWVLAVGNPFSLSQTVTVGIVSAVGRSVTSTNRYENYIQTDAAINPGNSGGALVNIRGELIGINTMIFTQSGGFMGIGFAIPINMARRAMEDLVYLGRVIRGWFGVSIQQLSSAAREGLDIPPGEAGALVADVFEGQPAERAGMKRGDVIVAINGQPVRSTNELRNIVATLRPGRGVEVVVLRDGRRVTLRVKVGER
jgi:serine protease Do